jgi:hypothetical protein
MNKNIRRILVLCTIVTGISNFSCSGRVPAGGFNPSAPPSVDPKPTPLPEPKPGDDVDIKYLETFNPAFAAGMKYTFLLTTTTGSVVSKPVEVSSEILEATADTLKVRIKGTDGTPKDKTLKIADFTNPTSEVPADQVKFKFAGKEDLKVAAGNFKAVSKISTVNAAGAFTGWFAPGVGMVKKTLIDAKKITTNLELKEFKEK